MTFLVDLLKRIIEIFKTVLNFIGADLDDLEEAVSNLF